MAMLPDSFLDWWFSPWTYAGTAVKPMSKAADLLGRRDAYRLWCAQTGVTPGLPGRFDAAWQVAVTEDGARLASSARLFAGLIAARRQDRNVLGQLAIAERKWCMSIALVQPLAECAPALYAQHDGLEVRGLTELSCRLERDFPGMWSRLRLLLPATLGDRIDALLEVVPAAQGALDSSALRATRCWRLCCQRAAGDG